MMLMKRLMCASSPLGARIFRGTKGPEIPVSPYLFNNLTNTSLAAKGALAHRLQRRTTCKIQNSHQGAPKMADRVWKGVDPQVFGHSKQLSLNKFLDPSTPSLLVGDHPWWVTILGLVADGV